MPTTSLLRLIVLCVIALGLACPAQGQDTAASLPLSFKLTEGPPGKLTLTPVAGPNNASNANAGLYHANWLVQQGKCAINVAGTAWHVSVPEAKPGQKPQHELLIGVDCKAAVDLAVVYHDGSGPQQNGVQSIRYFIDFENSMNDPASKTFHKMYDKGAVQAINAKTPASFGFYFAPDAGEQVAYRLTESNGTGYVVEGFIDPTDPAAGAGPTYQGVALPVEGNCYVVAMTASNEPLTLFVLQKDDPKSLKRWSGFAYHYDANDDKGHNGASAVAWQAK